ncbi:MAG: fibronectin type III domain-containing protein [Firmicutes bacterium]|nr:fibronectin type III domain-containing protein [Bacillota bacterium]
MMNFKRRSAFFAVVGTMLVFALVLVFAFSLSGRNISAAANSSVEAPRITGISGQTVHWEHNTSITATVFFRVYIDGTPRNAGQETSDNFFDFSSLTLVEGRAYSFAVRAIFGGIQSDFSDSVLVTIRTPIPPSGLTAGQLAGIIVGGVALLLVAIVVVLILLKKKKGNKEQCGPFEKKSSSSRVSNQNSPITSSTQKSSCLRDAKEEVYKCSEIYDIALRQVEIANLDEGNELLKNQAMNTILQLSAQVEKARECVEKYKQEVCHS